MRLLNSKQFYNFVLNNIFIETFNPKTPVLRFKQINFNFNFYKNKLRFFERGVCLAKGLNNFKKRTVYSKGPNYNKKKAKIVIKQWSANFNFLTFFTLNFFQKKFKLFKLVKFVDGSLKILNAVHGDFIGKFCFCMNTNYNSFLTNNGSFILMSLLLKNSIFFGLKLHSKFIIAQSAGTYCQILSTVGETSEISVIIPSGRIICISVNKNLFVCLGRSAHIFNSSIV